MGEARTVKAACSREKRDAPAGIDPRHAARSRSSTMYRREPGLECCYYPHASRRGWFAVVALMALGVASPIAVGVLRELLHLQAAGSELAATVGTSFGPASPGPECAGPSCGWTRHADAEDSRNRSEATSVPGRVPAGPVQRTQAASEQVGCDAELNLQSPDSATGPLLIASATQDVEKPAPSVPTGDLPQATGLAPDRPKAFRSRPEAESVPGEAEHGARNVRVRDDEGRIRVARVYGDPKDGVVLLPDGRLGWTKGELAFTDEAFVPLTADALEQELGDGPYRDFRRHRTDHYLVFSRASDSFTRSSANLLESLYEGLTHQLRAKGFGIRDSEFPLVAVVFRSEAEFRAHDPVPEDVQAYYNVVSNRIVFYEVSSRDLAAPDMAALRRPQTVAHEGTHQILQNVGLQPRLAGWPLWLIEGLAEYFAPTTVGRDGRWDGANRVNPFHMATLGDLKDPLTFQVGKGGAAMPHLGRPPGTSTVEYLVTREQLSPTDYAFSWALTYYLANKRFPQFLEYLKELSHRPPLERATPEQHLADFRRHFPEPLGRMDRSIDQYLSSLKGYEALKHYAVTFEQPIARGIVRRGVLVSQSPAMARQWVDGMRAPDGGPVVWHAYPFPSRARARLMAEQWLNRP